MNLGYLLDGATGHPPASFQPHPTWGEEEGQHPNRRHHARHVLSQIHRHHCLGGGGVLLQAGLCKETASIIRGQPPPAPPSGPRAMMQCLLHLLPYCH